MHQAHSRHATSAKITARGSDPPANATPAGIDAAIAAPGAMSVILWKRTSRSPIASLRRPVFVVAGAAAVIASPGGRGTPAWPMIPRRVAEIQHQGHAAGSLSPCLKRRL